MARLPIVGGDAGNWGTILNTYLQVSHASDGTLNSGTVGATQANLPSLGGGLLLRGTYASRPAAASTNSGLYYLATDNNGGTLYQSTGSSWVQVSAGVTHGVTHSSGGADALTGNLDATARVGVAKSGTATGSRRQVNFIPGTNITITATDDATNEKVDVTINSTSGGLGDPGANGLVARTAANTTTARTITGSGANQITVTNGDGVAGDPTLSLPQDIDTGSTPQFAGLNTGIVTESFQSADNWSNGLIVQKRGNSGDINGAVLSGGEIGYHSFKAWDGTAYGRGAYVIVKAQENFTATAHGSSYAIFTTASGQPDAGERIRINETGVLIGGADPTHTLTLPYSATGAALYNTPDQTTNYERGLLSWSSNVLTLATQQGGAGTGRDIALTTASGTGLSLSNLASTSGYIQALASKVDSTASAVGIGVAPTWQASSGTNTTVNLAPTIAQSGAAAYTVLQINPTESSTGSGAKTLIDAKVGGNSKFTVSNAGSVTLADAANLAVGTTTGTKIGTAPTQKLGFYNATPVVQPTGAALTALSTLGLVSSPTLSTADLTSGTLPLNRGGTNATDAAGARTSLSVPQATGFASIAVGTTAPASPSVGDLWVDTN